MVKVVLVCTSAPELNGHPTGLWLEECATPYYAFLEKGYEVILASPAGGAVPIDENSLGDEYFTDASKKFMHDAAAVAALCHTKKLDDIDWNSVDAIYLAGGHGACVDFVDNPTLKSAIETIYAADKVVAADCHGPIALAQCKKSDGTPLVQGKSVTAYSDSEEYAMQLQDAVPFLIESRFKELGAKFEKAEDFHSRACTDNNIVTGQNPQSSSACASAVIDILSH
ncbi:hypothetical protein FisN_5Hh144 [Fistulifera solaris]|jgi:putative intracellular protease/amidase|uniref:DJ-1/PfpI domain-containing protein n=1 Tax=Fistulifera solaris TaxID=1519565 RepID=A0A1Z5JUG2_FISSO|nr:hypothetical protein FisN_5Hh144 [Fistulifera solaris]|eukprot:GAX17492.1 hypothetical protein FisN_5Hh144 [Fistulifera solaris]